MESCVTEDMVFSTDQLTFHDDGSLSVVFFGTKTDSTREGFVVKIPPGGIPQLDPIVATKCYINRTENLRASTNAVFITLNTPFKPIKARTIATILAEAITLAGLGNQGYTAKSFRPTGATAAVKAGCLPETAMQIGRWKTREVFFNRYAYPNAPQSFTGV